MITHISKACFFLIKKHWHILFLICLSLLPIVWFLGKGDAIINGVDTNFPLDPKVWFIRRLYMWNNLGNGGSDFSFAPAGIFFHLIQLVPYLVGLSLQNVEKISLIFWFGVIVFNSYIFSGNFVKQKLFRVLFVTLYTLNIYMFNSWENVKVANLSLVAGIPLLLHVFVKLKDNMISYKKAFVLTVLSSLILSGAGINPAYFLTAILALIIFAVSSAIAGDSPKKISFSIVWMIVIATLVSAYWILPTISFVFRNVAQGASIGSIGFNNWLDSLSENTSIVNILRLQGAWDWYAFDSASRAPLFLPYTPNYFYKFPFVLFSFIVPALSILSFMFVDKAKKKYYLSFAVLLVLGVFLGSGSHEPTGTLFNWMAAHIPYFSLFRSPWYIFTPLLTISLAGLTALFFDTLKQKTTANILVGLLIMSNIVYSYPLVTGRIFRPSRPEGFYVKFPEYIFGASKQISNLTLNRTATYPDDQLEKFNWGYIGVEPVINLFSNNEMVFSAINNNTSPFSLITNELYKKVKMGNFIAFKNLLLKLNVDTILEKYDQQTIAPKISQNSTWQTEKIGEWLIHTGINHSKEDTKIGLINKFYFDYSKNNYRDVGMFGFIDSSESLINPTDDVVLKISDYINNSGKIIATTNSQIENHKKKVTKNIDTNNIEYSFEIPESGNYSPIIERHSLSDAEISDFNVYDDYQKISMKVNKVDNSYVYFEKIYLEKGSYKYKYVVKNNLIYENNFDSSGGQLELTNFEDHDIEHVIPLPRIENNDPLFITFDYQWKSGEYPLLAIKQFNDNTKFKIEKIGTERDLYLSTHNFYFDPVQTDSNITMSLIAQKSDSYRGTQVVYDNLNVYKLFTNRLYFVSEPTVDAKNAEIDFSKVSPIKYQGIVKNIINPQTIVFKENYSKDWRIKITDLEGNKIRYRADHFTIDLYANGWYIDTANKDFKFEIYYDPQKYFNIGVIISIISTVAIFILLALYDMKHLHDRKNKNNQIHE